MFNGTKDLVVVYITKDGKVLLGKKKKEPFKGCWMGPGGKVESGDKSHVQRAIDETWQESGLKICPLRIKECASLEMHYGSKNKFQLFVYLTDHYGGLPIETEEMGEFQWFSVENLPEEIPPGDKLWLKLVLSGIFIEGRIFFQADGQVGNFELSGINMQK